MDVSGVLVWTRGCTWKSKGARPLMEWSVGFTSINQNVHDLGWWVWVFDQMLNDDFIHVLGGALPWPTRFVQMKKGVGLWNPTAVSRKCTLNTIRLVKWCDLVINSAIHFTPWFTPPAPTSHENICMQALFAFRTDRWRSEFRLMSFALVKPPFSNLSDTKEAKLRRAKLIAASGARLKQFFGGIWWGWLKVDEHAWLC